MSPKLSYDWGINDFTAEDLNFTSSEIAKKFAGHDDTNEVSDETWPLHKVCSVLNSWPVDDYTPKSLDASLATQCTYYMRLKEVNDNLALIATDTPEEIDSIDTDPLVINVTAEKISNNKRPIFRELFDVFKECSSDNWDSYDAEQISINTYLEAVKFAELLPKHLPVPEVVPEPNGEIAFEWYSGRRFTFVASLNGKNVIEYAGLFGNTSKVYGAEYFGNEIAHVLIENINKIYS